MPDPTEPPEPTAEQPAGPSVASRLAAAWRDPRRRLTLLGGGAAVVLLVVVLLAVALAGGSDADDAADATTTSTTITDRDGDTVPDDEDADPDDPDVGRTTTTRRGGTTRTTDTTATTAGGGPGTGNSPPSTVRGGFYVPPTVPSDPVLERAYADGFQRGCDAIFGLSPNGRMFDPESPDDVYTSADCMAEMFIEYGNDYSTPDAAAEAGRTDAIDAAGLLTVLGKLCWDDDSCWDWESAF